MNITNILIYCIR